MDTPISQVFTPSGMQELFSAWNHFPDAVLYAGGTEHIRNQGRRAPVLPRNIIFLDKLDELRRVSRTERYLEIGAMVNLNQIIQLGRIVPEVLIRCIENIACPQVRNQATIGGNLCNSAMRLDCSAPMVALDAQFELRTTQGSRWIKAESFSSKPGPPDLGPQEILTRIRIPLEMWDFTRYRKFRNSGSNSPGENVLFMIKNEKDILTDIRVVYSGKAVLRNKDSETMLIDKRLPLDPRDAAAFIEDWKNYLSDIAVNDKTQFTGDNDNTDADLIKTQILAFIENTINYISD